MLMHIRYLSDVTACHIAIGTVEAFSTNYIFIIYIILYIYIIFYIYMFIDLFSRIVRITIFNLFIRKSEEEGVNFVPSKA